ncbi:uncharacterized protein LOC111640383 [Centruroides sculpturatus]|uniref:uncharacterized protein LOC111640383 n=1 Tax=Centruroides sculpturatus TaxID=218467 RepID=UPI000C6E8933|nr:uncharacterized protein LOC111640383 [Centruroides sculpturatus]
MYFGTVEIRLQYAPTFWSQMHPVKTQINASFVLKVEETMFKICLNVENCESYPYKFKYKTKIHRNITVKICLPYIHNVYGVDNETALLQGDTIIVKIFNLLKEKYDFRTAHVPDYDAVLRVPCGMPENYDRIIPSAVSETSKFLSSKRPNH